MPPTVGAIVSVVGLVDVVGPDEAGIGVVGNGVLEPNGGLIVPALGLIIVVGTDEVGIGEEYVGNGVERSAGGAVENELSAVGLVG